MERALLSLLLLASAPAFGAEIRLTPVTKRAFNSLSTSVATDTSTLRTDVDQNATDIVGRVLKAGDTMTGDLLLSASTLTVLSGGRLGIGTASPSHFLHSRSETGGVAAILAEGNDNSRQLQLKHTGSASVANFGLDASANFLLQMTSGEVMRILQSSRNVGIGTTSPSEKLHIGGNIAVSGTVDGRNVSTDGSQLDSNTSQLTTVATDTATLRTDVDAKVSKAGDSMQGALTLDAGTTFYLAGGLHRIGEVGSNFPGFFIASGKALKVAPLGVVPGSPVSIKLDLERADRTAGAGNPARVRLEAVSVGATSYFYSAQTVPGGELGMFQWFPRGVTAIAPLQLTDKLNVNYPDSSEGPSEFNVSGDIDATGVVTASTFNATSSSYQTGGVEWLNANLNLSVASGSFTGDVDTAGEVHFGVGNSELIERNDTIEMYDPSGTAALRIGAKGIDPNSPVAQASFLLERYDRRVGTSPSPRLFLGIAGVGATGYAFVLNTPAPGEQGLWQVAPDGVTTSFQVSTNSANFGYPDSEEGPSELNVTGDAFFTGGVEASTFNALGSSYQTNGVEWLDNGLNLSVSSGVFTGELDTSGQLTWGSGSFKSTGTLGGSIVLSSGAWIDVSTFTEAPAYREGRIFYDNEDNTLSYFNDDSDVTMNIGQESWVRARNNTGSTILNGKAVYISGALGNRPTVALAKADQRTTSRSIGLATHDIEDNTDGYVAFFGKVRGINTSSFDEGDLLFLSTSTEGSYTTIDPPDPYYTAFIGVVTRSNPAVGEILVAADPFAVIGDGSANQMLGMNDAADMREFKTIIGVSSQVVVTHTVGEIELSLDVSSVTLLGPSISTSELDFDPATQTEFDSHVSDFDTFVGTHSADASAHHAATVDTSADTICSGTDSYLDGDGNCDTLATGADRVPQSEYDTFESDVNSSTASTSSQLAQVATDTTTLKTDFDAHTSSDAVHEATDSNTAFKIVKRDGSGDFSAGTVTAALSGNATTATALASNGANCSAGNAPLGVDASGAAESCTDYVDVSGDTMAGNLTIGANKILTTNLSFWERTANTLEIRDSGDTVYKHFKAADIYTSDSLIFSNTVGMIKANNSDNSYVQIKARDSGVGLIEIARFQGAADPYFKAGSFYALESGDVGIGTASPAAALDVNGGIAYDLKTLAELQAITPGRAGIALGYCTNCTSCTVAISTGTTAGDISDISSKTTDCQ